MTVGAGRWPSSFERAVEFHRALDLPVGLRPQNLTQRRRRLRLALLGEEVGELVAAEVGLDDRATERLKNDLVHRFLHEETANYHVPRVDLAHIAKEACDVHTVVSGDMVERGIDEDRVFDVVHASNMAKAGGPVRADGKRLKPRGWRPPDVVAALAPGQKDPLA
jgi:predicted HAD superfamily Cof-like phosphohydrolase